MVADYSSCWLCYWTGYGHRGRSPSCQLRHWRALRASFWLRQGIYMFFFFVIWYLTLRRFFVLPTSTCFFNLCFLDDLRLLKPSEVKAFQGLGTGNRIATWLMYVSANLLTVILFVVFFLLVVVNSLRHRRGQKEEVNAFKDLGWGNRVATWLFYVSFNTLARSQRPMQFLSTIQHDTSWTFRID